MQCIELNGKARESIFIKGAHSGLPKAYFAICSAFIVMIMWHTMEVKSE